MTDPSNASPSTTMATDTSISKVPSPCRPIIQITPPTAPTRAVMINPDRMVGQGASCMRIPLMD